MQRLRLSTMRTDAALQEFLARLPRPGAGPAVKMSALQTVQTVRKSSETTVQLSQSDEQYTVSETGAPVEAASPNNGVTYIGLMDEKPSAEHDAKVGTLLESRRRRDDAFSALDAIDARRLLALSDGNAVPPLNTAAQWHRRRCDALYDNAVAPLGDDVAPLSTDAQRGTAVVPLVGAYVESLDIDVAPLDDTVAPLDAAVDLLGTTVALLCTVVPPLELNTAVPPLEPPFEPPPPKPPPPEPPPPEPPPPEPPPPEPPSPEPMPVAPLDIVERCFRS